MTEEFYWAMFSSSALTLCLYITFSHIINPKLAAWWGVIKTLYIVLFMTKLDSFDKYRMQLENDAKQRLNYTKIRLMEFDIYEGEVFHTRGGKCEMEPSTPYAYGQPMTRDMLKREVRLESYYKIARRYMV